MHGFIVSLDVHMSIKPVHFLFDEYIRNKNRFLYIKTETVFKDLFDLCDGSMILKNFFKCLAQSLHE